MNKFSITKRRPVSISAADLVIEQLPDYGKPLPLIVRPAIDGVELAEYLALHREEVRYKLVQYGGILFRDFPIATPGQFEMVARSIGGEMLEYTERSSPRTKVTGRVYTSTDYPADQEIFLHNENSYQQAWPMKLFFFCQTPPERGGETPIADTRNVYRRISAEIRNRFEEQGVLYVRNFGQEVGIPWRTAFQTEDRRQVERYCAARGITWEWKGADRLTTRAVRRASARHPVSNEMTWFNHLTFFHVSTLEPATRNALLSIFAEEDAPNNTYYGDGSPIEPEVLDHLRNAYRDETVSFAWRRGDLLALDNMLVAHGRAGFSGRRKILVAMSELFDLGAQ